MTYRTIFLYFVILFALSSCALFRATGDVVEEVGDGAGEVIEGVGDGASHAVTGTGRAIKKGVKRTADSLN